MVNGTYETRKIFQIVELVEVFLSTSPAGNGVGDDQKMSQQQRSTLLRLLVLHTPKYQNSFLAEGAAPMAQWSQLNVLYKAAISLYFLNPNFFPSLKDFDFNLKTCQ